MRHFIRIIRKDKGPCLSEISVGIRGLSTMVGKKKEIHSKCWRMISMLQREL